MTERPVPGMTGKLGARYDGKVRAWHDDEIVGKRSDGPGKVGRTVVHKGLKHSNLQDVRAPLWRHAF